MALCWFFARGHCRNGSACNFIHERDTNTLNNLEPAFPAIENLNTAPSATPTVGSTVKSDSVCTLFLRGRCNMGSYCQYAHPPQSLHSYTNPLDLYPSQIEKNSHQTSSESRSKVLCKYLARPGGCETCPCPYSHAIDGSEAELDVGQLLEAEKDEDNDRDDDFTREIAGATVTFGDLGQVLKIVLSADASGVCIEGLDEGATPGLVVDMLRGLGFSITIDRVHIRPMVLGKKLAMVEASDLLFARTLIAKLKSQFPALCATPMHSDSRRPDCRKTYVSWHKATQSVSMNFNDEHIANEIAKKFNEGEYKCLRQEVRSSAAILTSPEDFDTDSPGIWTINLSQVPITATVKDMARAIGSSHRLLRHVQMGSASYQASDSLVSYDVRGRLERLGMLENLQLPHESRGNAVKATALFSNESGAIGACLLLNNTRLEILGYGKLTVTLVRSTKIKVTTAVYLASRNQIDRETMAWRRQHLVVQVSRDNLKRFTTLTVEGDNPRDLANACRTLHEILNGVVLMDGDNPLWDSALGSNGNAYKKLKAIGMRLDAVVIRDRSKSRLLFYGPSERSHEASGQIIDMLKEHSLSTSHEIELNSQQFSQAMHGGFNSVEHVLGEGKAIFNVVSRKICINGTNEQYETCLAILNGNSPTETPRATDGPSVLEGDNPSMPGGDCPICFCEAETPTQVSCQHVYCLGCLEEYCKSSTTTGKADFQIKCQGDEGNCPAIFTLRQLHEHVSSSAFESVLKSSFEWHIRHHPENFRYCPTPDCGYVYRCTEDLRSRPFYTCPNCFESPCTVCHTQHSNYTCAEQKEDYEALEKLKRELNIKDCPKCTTPLEKMDGCNHMICEGCKAHICWVCMAVFDASGPCYAHLNIGHGRNGLGLRQLVL